MPLTNTSLSSSSSSTIPESDVLARKIVIAFKADLPCPRCNVTGKLTFSSVHGRLRVQCNNRAESCRKSLSSTDLIAIARSLNLPFDDFDVENSQPANNPKRPLADTTFLVDPDARRTRILSNTDDYTRKLENENNELRKQLTALLASNNNLNSQLSALQKRVDATLNQVSFPSASLPSNSVVITPTPPPANETVSLPLPLPHTLPSKPQRPSYAQIASNLGLTGSDQQAAIQALSRLSRRPPNVRSNGDGLTRIYVQGIGRKPIRDIKADLRALRFRTSCIFNISFLGSSTSEFLIAKTYLAGFQNRIMSLAAATNWRILSNYDASTASDANADQATKSRLQDAFVRRLHTIIRSTQRPAVKASYELWLGNLNLPLPTPSPIDTEMVAGDTNSIQC